MELSPLPLVLLLISNIYSGHTEEKVRLGVSPQQWLTEGDPVTLICEVKGSSTGWTFSWFTVTETVSSDFRDHYKLLSDSSRGAGGKYTISSATVNHTGVYVCRAEREETDYKTLYSNKQPLWVTGVSPRVSLIISPSRTQHFTSVSLSLNCEDQSNSDGWTVRRYTDIWGLEDCSSWGSQTGSTCTIRFTSTWDTGVYWCQSESGEKSHPVNITVQHEAQLSVSPQQWLTEGDPVTLICEVKGSSTGWTFSWFTVTETVSSGSRNHRLLSDSSRGAGGKYTVSSATVNHTGVYVCGAEREETAYKTLYSNKQLLWVTGVSPRVSLVISPNRSQHFTDDPLSLSCEDQSNSDGWTVRRYRDRWGMQDCSSSHWGSQTGSTCTIRFTSTWDTGVYWCQSESGEKSHPVNITVQIGVILESPVHPTEGDTLTLHCLDEFSTPSILRADFYKDESLIQSQTTEMIISTVSKSNEGFYYCKHPERGESPKSWISVRERPKPKVIIKPDQHVFSGETVTLRCDIDAEGVTSWRFNWYKEGSTSVFSEQQEHTFSSVTESDAGKYSCNGSETQGSHRSHISDEVTLTVSASGSDGVNFKPVIIGVTAGLTVVFLIIVFLVLLWRFRNNKGGRSESPSAVRQHQNISQTSEQNQSEAGYNTPLSGTAHVYDTVDATINKDRSTDGIRAPTEITYAEIELKSTNKQKKEKENKDKNTESCDVLYSQLKLETDQGSGSSDVTYAQVK
ncbi:Fc receptor-like protein 5 isoform X2 [Megalobrama amblycephala]|uniref:Fc receptor-like protein 5 isoform X2 n=1 Tax=Megalobrama amblycephala TaxID=75352 RepID=UPI002013E178|nr:Fc receptor-like protein 5 isoform X2 [Megalobrama amblycephala]